MKVVRSTKMSWVLTAAVCVALLCITAGGTMWYARVTQDEIERRAEADQVLSDTVEAEIIAIAERKAAEERARQERANEAADRAQIGDSAVDASDCAASDTHIDPSRIDVVVNKKHCMQPIDYEPSDLVSAHGTVVSGQIVEALNELVAAAAADGMPFSITSGYRSYQTQVSTYQHWVAVSGASGADTYSARPGYSEHQTGFVFDVAAGGCALSCFGATPQYQWLKENAAKYGFIQRYYKGDEEITGYGAEEWHYRYVGKDAALDMKEKGITTLEEYWGVPGGGYYYDLTNN